MSEDKGRGNWIQTHCGLKFHLLDPTEDEVCIEDIAHALSNMCRFAGHCIRFYSVAQHSVLCSYLVSPEFALDALMHDSPEAYVVDIPSPLKHSGALEEYCMIEDHIYAVIAKKYGLRNPVPPEVKIADNIMLRTEQRDVRKPSSLLWSRTEGIEPAKDIITPWSPEFAKACFFGRFEELTRVN